MSVKNSTDNELMALISQGNAAAFRELFDRYFLPLSMFADRFLSDTDLATDIVQGLFVTIYEQRASIDVSSARSFLYQSVRNRCLNEIKSRKVRSKYADAVATDAQGVSNGLEETIALSELEARLMAAIEQLPTQCRKIFEMSRFEGIANGDIAEQLALSKRTVETQISKALAILRKSLGDLFPVVAVVFQLLGK